MKNDCLIICSSLLDNTFSPVSNDGTLSIKHSIEGDTLILKFMTVLHYAEEGTLQKQMSAACDQAKQLIKQTCNDLKSNYKKTTGETLKLSPQQGSDDLEIVSTSFYSPKKSAYYRYNLPIKIS